MPTTSSPSNTVSRILRRHRRILNGRLRHRHLASEALGISKPYYVYEGPGLHDARSAPVLYLFRGHEREWVNMNEDASRRRSTAILDIDRLISKGLLPPMLVVMPGLNSSDNRIPSLGIDMAGTWSDGGGLGTGRFWTYLTEELFSEVESRYPSVRGGERLAAGFSLGGYSVALLASKRPALFDHAAMYDGLFMWPDHRDPREKKNGRCTDPVWCKAGIFDPALGKPRRRRALGRWNPTDTILAADSNLLDKIRSTTFWVACASGEGNKGNRDRARFFSALLEERGIRLGFDAEEVIFDPEAAHTWHWADRFLSRFLAGVYQ